MAFNLGQGLQKAIAPAPVGAGLSMTNPGAPGVTPAAALGAPAAQPRPVMGGLVAKALGAPEVAPAPAAPAPTGWKAAITNSIAPIVQKAATAAQNVVAQPTVQAPAVAPPAAGYDLNDPSHHGIFADAIGKMIAQHKDSVGAPIPATPFKLGTATMNPMQHADAIHNGALSAVQTVQSAVPHLDMLANAAAQKAQQAAQTGNVGEAIRQHALMNNFHSVLARMLATHNFATNVLAHTNAVKR